MIIKNQKLRNLYSIHDQEDKAIALILAKDAEEAKQIWLDKGNHELSFLSNFNMKNIKIKEIQKAFPIQTITQLLSERRMQPGKSLLCTKLARYYVM
jgi:hypothetical protein